MKAASVVPAFDDADLVSRCRQGDADAFSLLITQYQDRVFNTCLRMCGNRADAEDLTQEAFVRVLQSIGTFSGKSKFSTWVFRIAVNLVLSARRKRKPMYSLDQAGPVESERDSPASERLASNDPPPGEQASDRERHAIVLEALAGLEEEHRTVVILRDLESFGYEEIAEILGVPQGTVKSRLHRARLTLHRNLSPILKEGGRLKDEG
ncbi:MAG: sigma-70 family RNA polymerase sigma factor [Planctomycetota bacterium]